MCSSAVRECVRTRVGALQLNGDLDGVLRPQQVEHRLQVVPDVSCNQSTDTDNTRMHFISVVKLILLVFTVRNVSCGKIMFSQASVILSTGGGGCLLLVPGGFRRYPPQQTTPLGRHPSGQTPLPGQTPLQGNGYCCGRYASYWNAFLSKIRKGCQCFLQKKKTATRMPKRHTDGLTSIRRFAGGARELRLR